MADFTFPGPLEHLIWQQENFFLLAYTWAEICRFPLPQMPVEMLVIIVAVVITVSSELLAFYVWGIVAQTKHCPRGYQSQCLRSWKLNRQEFCILLMHSTWNRDSAVGIAIGYRLGDGGIGVRAPVGVKFFFLHFVQTGSGAHPASYPMGTEDLSPGGKVAGAWS
jgi:hypothetical protein